MPILRGMLLMLANIPPSEVWFITGIVAGGLALMCLRIVAAEMQWGMRLHELKVEAHRLRQHQTQQLIALNAEQEASREALRARREERNRQYSEARTRSTEQIDGEQGDVDSTLSITPGASPALARAA